MAITPSIPTQSTAVRASSIKTYLAPLCAVLATLLCAMSFVATAPAAAAGRYHISTHTCDVWLGGTDANVEIRLEGTAGTSPWLLLNDPGDDFRRGRTDTFSFFLSELGTLKSVVIKRDNAGVNPGWCLDYVSVQATINYADSYELFPSYNWIPNGGTGTRLYATS